ncbi:MAG: hypothetical protein K0Q97_2637 [Bacillota bacterium]|jgi:SagB-type dehydrogenase family enzyme|nr:hypothetical protein [Bacillota bacterium]
MENIQDLKNKIKSYRSFMKSNFGVEYESDQQKQMPQPPLVKHAVEKNIIMLTKDFSSVIKESNFFTILEDRKSNRVFKNESITIEQLSFLLWTTQGIKDIKGDNYATERLVPSGGARHPFETYLTVFNVESLEKGIYHYLPMEHALEFIASVDNFEETVVDSLNGQKWSGKSAVVFFYCAVPYRSEWRYPLEAHKLILLDAGHVMQNLYLSCGAVGCGTCAVAAFDQKLVDSLLKLDGEDEFVIYAAPVGVI